MAGMGRWTDLLDPTADELARHLPPEHRGGPFAAWAQGTGPDPRPVIRGVHDHVVGLLLNPVCLPHEDLVYFQEVGFVVTRESILTVRRTPRGQRPFDLSGLRDAAAAGGTPGEIAAALADEIAEAFLHAIDALDDEIDELEDRLEKWPPERTYRRLRALRHDLLNVRRVSTPTRDAIRAVVDGRIDVARRTLVSRDVLPSVVEQRFTVAHDKLLRAAEELEVARDLLATVRDYHQAEIANAQNDVVRMLTVVASLILLPTFIVGVYGQNFRHMPELGWRYGYAYSWALIALVTVAQVVFFRKKRWL